MLASTAAGQVAQMDTCMAVTAKAPGFVQPQLATLLQLLFATLAFFLALMFHGDEFLGACLSTVAEQGAQMGSYMAATVARTRNPGMREHTHVLIQACLDEFVHRMT